MMKRTFLSISILFMSAASLHGQENSSLPIPLWQEGREQGGWGGNHNATLDRDPEGILLKAGGEGDYGSVFKSIGEIDLGKHPFFVIEVDKADGAFSCKLINGAKNDKQVIFSPTAVASTGAQGFITHLPSQTGWSGKVPLNLGIYCSGANKSLRVKSIQFVEKPTEKMMERFDQVRNLLFDSSFEMDKPEQPPIRTWHRIGSYVLDETPWQVAEGDAFEGKQCARTTRPGKLVLQREIHERGSSIYTFSVYLKATKDGHKARLSITTYAGGKPFTTATESKDIGVGKEWARYDMTSDVPTIRNRSTLGATDFTIESLDEGELRADAMQFELGQKPTMYGANRSLLSGDPISNLRSPLYRPVEEPIAESNLPEVRNLREDRTQPSNPAVETGTVSLAPLGGEMPPAPGWPMIGTVTLPQGVSYDIKTWRLNSPDGKYLPAQTRILARWKGDGSIKGAQIIGQADGSKEWKLEYNSKAPQPASGAPAELKQPASVSMPMAFVVTSVEGKEHTSKEDPKLTRFEEDGPIHTIIRREGAHLSGDGTELLSFIARSHFFRPPASNEPNLTKTEYTWINTNASRSVVVSSIACRIPFDAGQVKGVTFFGAEGKRHEIDPAKGGSLLQCDEKRKYFYEIRSGAGAPERCDGKAEGRVRVDLGGKVLEVLVNDWWQNHPMEIAVDRKGLTIYFWPPRVKAVELTQGMAKTYTVDIYQGPKENAPARMAGPTQLVAPTSVHCRSGVFGGAILPSEGSPFPIYEKAVNSRSCLARMDPDVMLETDCYGQFNYGDCIGDGGWANLETQRGHSAWLHYLRTGDPRMFGVAQAAARHYRDIDINQLTGGTYVHNPSHTLSSQSTSHAWIQSMLDHYLTTGERRSMEVALLHADYLLKKPLESMTHGGREVTRILDNMADLYMLTGNDDLVKKYHEIVAAQRENLKKGKTEFPGVFQHEADGKWTYPANFVPWYGLYSQVKMRLATGDASWEKAFEEEMGYALAKLPFEYARPEYFTGNPLTDDQRIVRCLAEGAIGDRGCMLFPPLGYAWRWTKDKRYLDIGMATTYIAIISREYCDPLYALAAVFLEQAKEAGLGAEDEKRYYQEAVDIMKGAARPTLSNPGFEEGRKDWKAWSVKATTSSYWVPVRDQSMSTDAGNKKEGKQSLHIIIRRKCPPMGFGVPLDSEFFVVEKGKTYVIEGWVKTTDQLSAAAYLSLRPLSPDTDPQSFRAEIGKPAADGWRQWKLEATPAADSLARLHLSINRANPKSEGDAWWDGITVKETKAKAAE